MESREVCDKIDKCIFEQIGVCIEDIKPYSHLKDDLQMDSLDDVELVLALEEAFDIEISDEDAEKCKTVNDVYKGILGKLGVISLSDLELTSATDCKPEITKTLIPSDVTKEAFVEVKNCTFTTSDIFQQMLTLAKQHNMFIQFDGFTDNSKDAIVVTHACSDTEYVVKDKQEFDQLIESFNVLEKFERK